MKKLSILTCTMIALSSFMAINVQAGPHFVTGPTASLSSTDGDYCVAFKEAGLGSGNFTFTITATTAKFTFQCFTKSDNTPQGAPNSVNFSNLSAQTTLASHNGSIHGTVCLQPAQDCASCQGGGLVLKLIHVEYDGVNFCDSTVNDCVNNLGDLSGDVVPGQSFPSKPPGCR